MPTVHFYRIVHGTTQNRLRPRHDSTALGAAVNGLSLARRRQHLIPGQELSGSWRPGPAPHPETLILAKIRSGSSLPPVATSAGGFRGLGLAAGEGIAEVTHVTFFADDIVGLLRTQHGPTIDYVSQWINVAVHPQIPVGFAAVPDQALIQRLGSGNVARLNFFTVRIDTAQRRALARNAPRLFGGLNALEAGSTSLDVEITIRPEKTNQQQQDSMLSELQGLLGAGTYRAGEVSFRDVNSTRSEIARFTRDFVTYQVQGKVQGPNAVDVTGSIGATLAIRDAYAQVQHLL